MKVTFLPRLENVQLDRTVKHLSLHRETKSNLKCFIVYQHEIKCVIHTSPVWSRAAVVHTEPLDDGLIVAVVVFISGCSCCNKRMVT